MFFSAAMLIFNSVCSAVGSGKWEVGSGSGKKRREGEYRRTNERRTVLFSK
jgi:hypothetical protein